MIVRKLILGLVMVVASPWTVFALEDSHGHESANTAVEDPHGEDDHASHDGHGDDHASHDGHGSANPLTINPDLALFTAAIFVVLLIVLSKFAWGPIVAALDSRERQIADNIDEAQRAADDAKQQMADYEVKLSEAADEVRAMLDEARRDAESTRQRIVNEAQDAANEEKQRALREIDLAKRQALEELWQESVDRAFDLAGQVVGRELDAKDHAKLIQESADKLPSQT